MARPKKSKPKTPKEIAAEKLAARARDLAAVNIHASAAALPSFHDVDVTHAQRDSEDGARRADAFIALRDGMSPGSYDAARRLETDIATRHGEAGKGPPPERVDQGSTPGGITDAMLTAGQAVDWVLSKVGMRDAWLLSELIRPSLEGARIGIGQAGRPRRIAMTAAEGWRGVVAYITGESNPVAQAAAVRSACANLVGAYVAYDAWVAERKRRLAA